MNHATLRAWERYRISMVDQDLPPLADQCRGGRCRLRRLPNGTEHHLVSFEGRALIAVYDPRPHVIMTFLPSGARLRFNA